MFELAYALCVFAGPATTELECNAYSITTEDCVETFRQLSEQYEHTEYKIKLAVCAKKIKHPKIQSGKPYKQLGRFGT